MFHMLNKEVCHIFKINKYLKKKKRFSLVELSIVIILLPLILGIASSIFIQMNKTTKIVNTNTILYSDLQKVMDHLILDTQKAYAFKQDTNNSFYLSTPDGVIKYEFREDISSLYRNEFFLVKIHGFELADITTKESLFPLYKMTIKANIEERHNMKEEITIDYDFSLNFKK